MIPFLKPGDRIAICSPAKQINQNLLNHASNVWKNEGYEVEITPNASGQYHYFSGTIPERLGDFQMVLDDKNVKAIVCARGGYGAVQILDQLDWTTFKENPKWIIGFSDITNFHLELAQMGFPGIHATMPLNYYENSAETFSSLFSAIRGEPYQIVASENNLNQIGSATGKLIGGNLSIVYSLLSRYPSSLWKDKILYIEDVGEQLYHFDRMFYALKFAGVWSQIKGVVVGSFTEIKDTELGFGKNIEELILDHIQNLQIPVGFGFPAGHQDDNQALIMGSTVELRVERQTSRLIFRP